MTNFSSHGEIYMLIVILDVLLLFAHVLCLKNLLQWTVTPERKGFQEWIRNVEKKRHGLQAPSFLLPGTPIDKTEGDATESPRVPSRVDFREIPFYGFFDRSYYRTRLHRWCTITSRTFAWMIIVPNSVVWTWSESATQKWQAYLSSIKSWIIVVMTFSVIWRTIVATAEAKAYAISRATHITSLEIAAISALVALWLQADIFSICEQKWALEHQRVNDVTSFADGYLVHGNTYSRAISYRHFANVTVIWIIYRPLVKITIVSIVVIFAWLGLRAGVLRLWGNCRIPRSGTSQKKPLESYARLPLETLLDLPIRARSIIRLQLPLEITYNGHTYVRPGLYLEYGVMLKPPPLVNHISYHAIVRREVEALRSESLRGPSSD